MGNFSHDMNVNTIGQGRIYMDGYNYNSIFYRNYNQFTQVYITLRSVNMLGFKKGKHRLWSLDQGKLIWIYTIEPSLLKSTRNLYLKEKVTVLSLLINSERAISRWIMLISVMVENRRSMMITGSLTSSYIIASYILQLVNQLNGILIISIGYILPVIRHGIQNVLTTTPKHK